MVSAGPSESKRDGDQPWFDLLRGLGDGTLTPKRGIAEALRCWESSGEGSWGLPLAFSYWSLERYQECCDVLEHEDVQTHVPILLSIIIY